MMGQQQTVAGSTVRRMILALAIAAVMALLLGALAVPAFAASGKANLVGQEVSAINTDELNDEPGKGGQVASTEAQNTEAQNPVGLGDTARFGNGNRPGRQ